MGAHCKAGRNVTQSRTGTGRDRSTAQRTTAASRRRVVADAGWPGCPRHYAERMVDDGDRPATVADVHEFAQAMPHVTVYPGTEDRPVYQVGAKSFVFFRNPRPDAVDPSTGERYDDVIVLWVESETEKEALVQDRRTPYFTTPHFAGHRSVLVRASRLGELTRAEVAEQVQDAWLARASRARATAWLRDKRAV
jgi:hypothetical protein